MAWAQILTQTLTNWVTLGMFLNLSLFHFPHIVKGMVFPEVMYRCESWTVKKNERWRIDAFELWCWRRLLRVPWTARRSNQSILKEINPGCSLDTETETPILWPHDVKSWLIGKDPDPGKDWRQEEKGMTDDEMVEWHHQLDRHEFEWAPGVGDEQGSLACCSRWGHRELDTTEQLNWSNPEEVKYPGLPTLGISLDGGKRGKKTEKHLWRSQYRGTGQA